MPYIAPSDSGPGTLLGSGTPVVSKPALTRAASIRAAKNKKNKNALGQLLNPVPTGPGSPTSKKGGQKVLIHEILTQKPITTKRQTNNQQGQQGTDVFGAIKKGVNGLGKALGNIHPGASTTGPPVPIGSTNNGSSGGNSPHQRAAQRIAGSNNGAGQKMGSGDTTAGPKSTSLMGRAKETIAAQMNPLLAEYQQQIKDTNTSSNQQQADLGDLYRRLGIQIGADQTAGDVANAAAMSGITDKYNTLQGQVNSTYDAATAGTNSELSRLGIGAVGPAATAQQGADKGYLGGLTAIDKTNAQANSTSQSQSFDNLLTTLHSQGQLAGTMDRSKVLRQAAQAISDLQSKRGALAATRRGAVDSLYNQLKDAQTKSEADAAQQQFMDKIAAGKLGIEQGNLGVAQGKLSLDAQNSSSQRDLRTAQALKYIHDAKRPYSSYSSSSSKANAPKGYGAGLAILNGVNTKDKNGQQNAAALSKLALAKHVYNYYYTKIGSKALTELETRLKASPQTAGDYLKLPADLQASVVDALRAAGAS